MDVRVHETRYSPEDVFIRGVCAVTVPLRTIIDLLFTDRALTPELIISIRMLSLMLHSGRNSVNSYLDTHRRPHRARAYRRWEQCL